MPKTVKYIGTVTRWPELATTGKQSTWVPGQQEQRSDTEAAQLLATGLFSDVDATQLPEQKVVAISGVVSEDGTVESLLALSKDADQGVNFGTDEIIVSAAGSFLLRASACRLVKVRCLSGTAGITLRNGITNSVTAADTTSRILWKGAGIVAGSEPYVPRGDNGAGILVTEGLHLTLAGASPVVAIYIR